MITYSSSERIEWRRDGLIWRKVAVQTDKPVHHEPDEQKRRSGRSCVDCGKTGIRFDCHRCPSCAESRRKVCDPATVERVLSGEWRIKTTRADRIEVMQRWTGSLTDLETLTGWNVWRLARQARPTREVA